MASLSHGLAFAIRARESSVGSVTDSISGMTLTPKAIVNHEGHLCWDLRAAYLEYQSGTAPTVQQLYTHAVWVFWRSSDSGWRTLFRASSDHTALVRDGGRSLGMFSNRDGDFRDSGYDISADMSSWQLVLVTGEGDGAASASGTSTFYTAAEGDGEVRRRGTVDRVACGASWLRLGWPGQGPGWVAAAYQWDRVLTGGEMNRLLANGPEAHALAGGAGSLAPVTLHVRAAMTAEPLLGPLELPGDAVVADVMRRIADSFALDEEAQRFVGPTLLHRTTPLEPHRLLAEVGSGAREQGTALEFSALVAGHEGQQEISLLDVAGLSRAHPKARSVVVTAGTEAVDLRCVVEKLPQLEELQIRFNGSFLYGQPASYWAPLQDLASLRRLHFSNHHGGCWDGAMAADAILEALLGWGDGAPKLLSFKIEGAMRLDLGTYENFVTNNRCLRPELEEFVVQYWYANPPLVNTRILQQVTKRYRKLRLLEVGSCCHSVTDAAFQYFEDNGEGLQAGLELEDLFLVCITQVEGAGWLDLENVRKNLPKLRKFRIGAGRAFCNCGARGCGSAVPRIQRLREEFGLEFHQSAAHW